VRLPEGGSVRLHQGFRCCPYAGMVLGQLHDWCELNGLSVVEEGGDVQLVHSCGSDASQAQLTWDALAGLQGHEGPVLVTGCLARIDPEGVAQALSAFPQSLGLGPKQLDRLDGLLAAPAHPWDRVPPSGEARYSGTELSSGFTHILASTGCLGTCGFCAIRKATGRPRSRGIEQIVGDVQAAVQRGERDLLLVSTDLSAWGSDRGQTVLDLLRALLELPDGFLLSAESFEPTLLLQHRRELLPLLGSGRFAMLGVPIQSGSARVLRQMNRVYEPQALIELTGQLASMAPGTLLRTDILYGFGDETEQDFELSVQASRSFHLPSFNAYQPRPGTTPLQLAPEVLLARRALAEAELVRRAERGLLAIPRWGRQQAAPRIRPKPRAQVSRPSGPPWTQELGRLWLRRKALRLGRLVPRAIGGGWTLTGVEEGRDAVELTLERAGESARLGLRPLAWPGQAAWTSATLRIWVYGEAPEGLSEAVQALLGRR
jgi:tRNA A37 methylthiotransferase MiaB